MRALALGLGLALAAGLTVLAQDNSTGSSPPSSSSSSSSTSAPPPGPPGVPVLQAPPEVSPPSNDASADDENQGHAAPAKSAAVAAPKPPPPPPQAAPKPTRSSTAVLQALDKVTTETMRFAAPVGQPIRYKNLVFTVKACETSGLGSASPQSSAYVVIDLAPPAGEGIAPPPPHQVFKGWMFANSPGLNPFQHPIYDAWLIACTTTAPPA